MTEAVASQAEYKRIDARVSAVEQEVEGEKILARYILSQARQNGDDLAALKLRVDRIEQKIDGLESRLVRVETDLGALRRELPAIVAEAMREVLREPRSR